MGFIIERRVSGRGLYLYCLLDPEFYEDLSHYVPRSGQVKEEIEASLQDGWEVLRDGIWYHVSPSNNGFPAQGFKIHLSANPLTANILLRRVLPVLAQKRPTFKVLVDTHILSFVNSKNFLRAAAGKFVTIYPKDQAHFRELLECIHCVTSDMQGPHILSDKPYGNSKVVFYRYGGFAPRYRLNIYGEKVPVIVSPGGSEVDDVRLPYFKLPEWVEDPFQFPELIWKDQVVLNGKYQVEGPLGFSNSGGVYKARSIETNDTVVIKEARPFVNLLDDKGTDAVALLQKEHRVLLALQETGFVPRVVDYFREWDHHFIVQEYIGGYRLSSFRASEEFGLVVSTVPTPAKVRKFCDGVRRIGLNLIRAVKAFHSRGIIVGDIATNNLLVDPDTLNVKFVDFESAFSLAEDNQFSNFVFTPGFGSDRLKEGKAPTFEDDYYALGCVLFSIIFPVQILFDMKADAKHVFLDAIVKDYGLPSSLQEAIYALMEADADRSEKLLEHMSDDLCEKAMSSSEEAESEDHQLRLTIQGIANYILANTDVNRGDRLWPSDYRIFTTNPLNIAYGSLGIALYLKSALGAVPDQARDWILRQPLNADLAPPGLYTGLAGIAWALYELGFAERAFCAIEAAYNSPLLYEGCDLFYGMSGIGLASLYFWYRTGDTCFLRKAREAGDRIVSRAVPDLNGFFWPNFDQQLYLGCAHGGSGIALFLLHLYLATRETPYLEYAVGALDNEIGEAIEKDGALAWERVKGEGVLWPYWRSGSAGIGSVLIRFYAALGDERYKALAKRAAAYASTKYTVFPGQFSGASGIGELCLDLYYFTGDKSHLEAASRMARKVLLFRLAKTEGFAFPGEELIRISADFGTGSAGVGMFLSRLRNPGPRLFYEIEPAEGANFCRTWRGHNSAMLGEPA